MTRGLKKAGFAQGIYQSSASQKERLGTLRILQDGRQFVYCKNGAVALAAGGVCASIITAGMKEETVTVAHPIGTTIVTITDSGSATAEDAYKGGTLIVTGGIGVGESYTIAGNTAATTSATFSVFLEDPLVTAWAIATTDVVLEKNKYDGVVVNPVDGQQLPVCVPQRIIPVSYYFWGQVLGHGAMLMDVDGQAAGLELDEKRVVPSLTHPGFGFVDTAPNGTKVLAGYRHLLGYVVDELDIVDNEAAMVQILIGI